LPVEESSDKWMRTVIFEFLRVAFGNDAFCTFIQHDDSLCKGEYACQFVGDNHHGGFAHFYSMGENILAKVYKAAVAGSEKKQYQMLMPAV